MPSIAGVASPSVSTRDGVEAPAIRFSPVVYTVWSSADQAMLDPHTPPGTAKRWRSSARGSVPDDHPVVARGVARRLPLWE